MEEKHEHCQSKIKCIMQTVNRLNLFLPKLILKYKPKVQCICFRF